MRDHAAKGLRQLRAAVSQFVLMMQREGAENAFALRQEANEYFTAVLFAAMAPYVSVTLETVDQLHRAVMPQLHPIGKGSDRGAEVRGKPFDGQQQLVLLGIKPCLAGSQLAEVQEASNLMAEFRQRAIIYFLDVLHGFISYHDIYRAGEYELL